METSIYWNNQGSARSIKDSIEEVKMGNDIGWMGTKNLMPRSDDFHHWMHFAHLLTVLHNRDCSPKKFSILRIGTDLDIGGGGRLVTLDVVFYFRTCVLQKTLYKIVQKSYIYNFHDYLQ